MKIGLLQLNFTVGDLDGNASKIIHAVKSIANDSVDLCVTSELALLGYPPRDLLLNSAFMQKSMDKLSEIAESIKNAPPLILGFADINRSDVGLPLYNAAALIQEGEIKKVFHKTLLPNYDVFDETRYFEPSTGPDKITIGGYRIGITICEDIWNDKSCRQTKRYRVNPVDHLASSGVECIINISASPFTTGKQQTRETMMSEIASKHKTPIIYVNQVGGSDDILFDGRSCVFNASGKLIKRCKLFEEDIVTIDLNDDKLLQKMDDVSGEEEIWKALVSGTSDYIHKCGFKKALLGLSGGIDSALTAAVAVEAIGEDNVLGVLMPSPYSSNGSIDDALKLARNLGIQTITIPIEKIMESYSHSLADSFKEHEEDKTEENIQSRIRGNLLMALSNKYNSLLLTTGNKSELAVGYCTIYGDMSGGLAVISDVPKTMVYKISGWLNEAKETDIIPEAIMEKPPSAELKPDQTDQDSLPPYEELDEILRRCVDLHQSSQEIVEAGFEEETVKQILHLVKIAEFKRKQAAPGLKVTDRAFGTGWRMPIACKPPK